MADKIIIDVSKHNGVIDWAKVKESGIDGAIIRVGYGSDTPSQDDLMFKQNADACVKNKIPFGVYLYSYANNDKQIESEVKHITRLIKGYKLGLPVFLDLEQAGTEKRAEANANKFIELINKTEYTAGIYASEYWFKSYLSNIKDCWHWVAKYGKNDGTPQTKPNIKQVDLWQYTSKGKVSGVNGFVDKSILYKEFIKSSRKTTTKPSAAKSASKSSTKKKDDAAAVKIYKVKEGDTLTAIAKKHKTTVAALVKKNNIKDKNKIITGQVLKI